MGLHPFEVGSLTCGPERSADVATVPPPAKAVGEDRPLEATAVNAPFSEHLDAPRRHDQATLGGLRLDMAGDQALALDANDCATHGDSSGGQVEVGPGRPERFVESQAGREHEPRQLGQIVMLGSGIGIEYPKPLANLLQGERSSGLVAIEFQRGEVADGITRQSTTPHQPPADPRQHRPGELGRCMAAIDKHRLDEAIQAGRGHFTQAE